MRATAENFRRESAAAAGAPHLKWAAQRSQAQWSHVQGWAGSEGEQGADGEKSEWLQTFTDMKTIRRSRHQTKRSLHSGEFKSHQPYPWPTTCLLRSAEADTLRKLVPHDHGTGAVLWRELTAALVGSGEARVSPQPSLDVWYFSYRTCSGRK